MFGSVKVKWLVLLVLWVGCVQPQMGTEPPEPDTNSAGDTDTDTDVDTDADSDADSDSDSDSDADSDSDSDSDSDADSDSDTDECNPSDACCDANGSFEPEGTICGVDPCPANECIEGGESLTYNEYPDACDLTCDGAGNCAAECTCEVEETTACQGGTEDECCSPTCNMFTGCGSQAGTCADVCEEGVTVLVTDNECTGCGGNNANGTCSGGVSMTCEDKASLFACDSTECNGTTLYCHGKDGTWQWYLTDSIDDCGDGCCNGSETDVSCPDDCGCGDGTCEDGETNCNCPEDCPDPLLDVTWDSSDEGWTLDPATDTGWVRGTAPSSMSGCDAEWKTNTHFFFEDDSSVPDNYSQSLNSPTFDLTGCDAAHLIFDLAFREYSTDYANTLAVKCYDGSTWQTIATFDETDYEAGCFELPQDLALPAACMNHAAAGIAFTASGENSLGIWEWHIDNLKVQNQ
ncbi:MAG: hypothetical protein QNJ97_25595 [Myxococcota bacterium]|nr:hypothetical protein [Myxococcota bacterium]